MDDDVFKQFEEQFGREWGCSCGSSFESESVEIVSQTKNSILARYTCQICGREQIFAVSVGGNQAIVQAPIIEIPKGPLSSDNVLDIKKETEKITLNQIRVLGRRKTRSRVTTPKITRN
ncbi:MAG TPA: hypothetical protein VF303_00125 [Candidatus Nanoarchaeia archaeon]